MSAYFNFEDDDFTFEAAFTTPEVTPEPEPPLEQQEVVKSPEVKPVADMSDAEVDSVFNDLASLVESDEEVQKTASAIMEAEYLLAEAEKEIQAGRVEYDELAKTRLELQKQLDEIISRMAHINSIASPVRAKKREAEYKVNAAKRAHEVAKQNARVKWQRQQENRNFLEIAKDKAWWNGITYAGDFMKIMEHQWTGAQFLASAHGAILGDGMGLGKSLSVIAGLDLVNSKKALVIAQADVTTNFDNEFRMWAPHRNVVNIRGMSKYQRNQLLDIGRQLDNLVVIVNYEAWRKDLSLLERLISMGFDTVIADEAHNIKSTDTDAYKGIRHMTLTPNMCPRCQVIMPELIDSRGNVLKGQARMCTQCAWNGAHYELGEGATNIDHYYHIRSVKNVWMVTGTPILNKPQDLFAELSLIDPINFVRKNDFLRDYCEMDYYTGKWRFRSGGVNSLLKHRLNGRYLARTYEDAGITLPPQMPTIHDIEFEFFKENYPAQYDVVEQITNHGMIVMNSGKKLPMLAQIAVITRQRQANVWPGGISWTEVDEMTGVETLVKVAEEITESIKMDKAIEIISEAVDRGERVVLFSQFKTALAELQARVNGLVLDSGQVVKSVRYDGDTPSHLRDEIKANFDKKGHEEKKWDVVLANYRVGGTGLNLTAATTTIILDEEWNPGKRDQSYARTRRLGQDETTFVHVLRLERTVDTWLAKLIEEKEKMIGGFNESALDMQAEWLKAFKAGELGEFGK